MKEKKETSERHTSGLCNWAFVNVALDMIQKRAEKKPHSHMEGAAENFLRRENLFSAAFCDAQKYFRLFSRRGKVLQALLTGSIAGHSGASISMSLN